MDDFINRSSNSKRYELLYSSDIRSTSYRYAENWLSRKDRHKYTAFLSPLSHSHPSPIISQRQETAQSKEPIWTRSRPQKLCTVSMALQSPLRPQSPRQWLPSEHTLILIPDPVRINNDVSQLLQRFENIMATATVRSYHLLWFLWWKLTVSPGRKHKSYHNRRRNVPARCRVYGIGTSVL